MSLKPVTEVNILAVFNAAKEAAAANVAGYTFIGAWREAEKAGYEKHTTEHDLFVSIFLNHIPDAIQTDDSQVIK